jgi:glycyl-tRNA synthetase beta chain
MSSSGAPSAPLLIELFTEELPPKALARLGQHFAESITAQLKSLFLLDASAQSESFASPRRLAVRLPEVLQQAATRQVELKGPSLKVGLDAQGQPTQALLKWAEKQGQSVASLERVHDGKQEVFVARIEQVGQTLAQAIGPVIDKALASLPIPKLMRYQLADGQTTVSFVRPAHRLIVLHGQEVVDCEVLGLRSSRLTEGHRFLSAAPISITSPQSYAQQLLAEGKVIASFAQRRQKIQDQLHEQAAALGASLGDQAHVDPLLDEVTALVEWPVVLVGRFEEHFLSVPQECLILTMRTNQKYFPLFTPQGQLRAEFLIVSNMQVADPSMIIDGNQRVVRPRLADAKFFFEQDLKVNLASRLPGLSQVMYHAKLGSQAERSARVQAIALALAARLQTLDANPQWVARAAQLAKADLLSNMVGEFPELQGLMGSTYARKDGEPEEVALAIAEHYQPRFSGDALPTSTTGLILAMADKLETMCGMFSIGQVPTGDKDPFALRRHALGVLRMAIERGLSVQLEDLVDAGFAAFHSQASTEAKPEAKTALAGFMNERLAGLLRDAGHAARAVQAVLACGPLALDTVSARLQAVASFEALPEAPALAAANKRIQNILSKNAGEVQALGLDDTLLQDPAEQALAQWMRMHEGEAAAMMQSGRFRDNLMLMATARPLVDAFFDKVMVMAPEPALRANRIALLKKLHAMMNQVADLSTLSA